MAELWSRIAEPYDWPYCPLKAIQGVLMGNREDFTRQAKYRQQKHRRAWEAVRDQNGAIKYVVSYATKPRQKVVPDAYRDVGRFWGVSRGVRLEDGLYLAGNEDEARELISLYRTGFDSFEVLPRVVFI